MVASTITLVLSTSNNTRCCGYTGDIADICKIIHLHVRIVGRSQMTDIKDIRIGDLVLYDEKVKEEKNMWILAYCAELSRSGSSFNSTNVADSAMHAYNKRFYD